MSSRPSQTQELSTPACPTGGTGCQVKGDIMKTCNAKPAAWSHFFPARHLHCPFPVGAWLGHGLSLPCHRGPHRHRVCISSAALVLDRDRLLRDWDGQAAWEFDDFVSTFQLMLPHRVENITSSAPGLLFALDFDEAEVGAAILGAAQRRLVRGDRLVEREALAAQALAIRRPCRRGSSRPPSRGGWTDRGCTRGRRGCRCGLRSAPARRPILGSTFETSSRSLYDCF